MSRCFLAVGVMAAYLDAPGCEAILRIVNFYRRRNPVDDICLPAGCLRPFMMCEPRRYVDGVRGNESLRDVFVKTEAHRLEIRRQAPVSEAAKYIFEGFLLFHEGDLRGWKRLPCRSVWRLAALRPAGWNSGLP